MYEAYFGLANLPFCIAPDSRFFVDAQPHRAALRALQDRLCCGDEFVPLLGDFGAGKTTVGRRMLQEIDRARQVAAELPLMRIEGDQLFDRLAEALGLRRAGGGPPLASMIRQLEGLVRDGRDALLLVDEAQELDVAALRRLRKLTTVRVEGRAALRVCLAGRRLPPAMEELRRIGQPLNIGAPVLVGPLDAAGTHAYILERLDRAGWRGRPAFESATAAIHDCCQGNPGRINRLCGHILLQLYIQGRDDLNADVVHAVDELQRAELRGETATLALPPLSSEMAEPPPVTEALPAMNADALADVGTAVTPLEGQTSPASVAPHAEVAALALTAAADAYDVKPRRQGLAQGVAALALLVGGGFVWQMVSNLATARSASPLHPAAVAAAALSAPANQETSRALSIPPPAGLAAMAEQAIAQSPPRRGANSAHRACRQASREIPDAAIGAQDLRSPRRCDGCMHSRRRNPGPVQSIDPTCAAAGCRTAIRARSGVRRTCRTVPPPPSNPTCDPARAALALCPDSTRAAH
jgi:type II secretory pathway predicted ATPase ExeA